MPIEQPAEFGLLNRSEDRKTSSLGYTPIFIATADEVIQCFFRSAECLLMAQSGHSAMSD